MKKRYYAPRTIYNHTATVAEYCEKISTPRRFGVLSTFSYPNFKTFPPIDYANN